MDFNGVSQHFKEDLLRLEKTIEENYRSEVSLIPDITGYLMGGGGKRMRPLLLMICARICGLPVTQRVINHCCVIEYIHTSTLLHDDVVDETTVRRGNETVNSKWGSDASILTGDYLLARAILLLSEDIHPEVVKTVANSAKTLVEGGMLEYSLARKLDVTEELLIDVIVKKTSSIISASCQLGAILADSDAGEKEALAAFGHDFGVAFQLVDDVMDYDSSEEALGKPAGTDFKEGHVTLPLLHLYQNSDASLKKQIEGFIQNENIAQKDLEFILDRMREEKSLEYSMDVARSRLESAKAALKSAKFKCPENLEMLIAFADHIIERYSLAKTFA